MALSYEGVQNFTWQVVRLQSFPVFCAYILMIFLSGLWQKYTKPLSLRKVMIIYDFLCSIISLYTLIGFLYGLYKADHIYQKSPTVYLESSFYWYHVTKKIELMDTVFMVLRHRRRQISFLQVYHHSSMLLLSEYSFSHTPWPAIAVILMVNSFVHVFLYLHYGICALYPETSRSWKQRLTELQIIQFYVDLIFAFYGYLHHGFCVYGFIYGALMIYLFTNFYYLAYIKKRSGKTKLDASVQNNNAKKVE